MKLMSIDPGTKEMGIMIAGSMQPFTIRADIFGLREWRFASLMDQLSAVFELRATHIDTVLYERPFGRGMDATRCLWGIAGIIEAVATKHGCAVLDIDNMTLKKWALGSAGGERNKEPMIAKAAELGYSDLNEHEADAVLLYRYGLDKIEVGKPNGKK